MKAGKKIPLHIAATLMFGWMFQLGVMEGVPYLLTFAIGREGTITYTVEDTIRQKGCRPGVNVEEISFSLSDRVCGISGEFSRTLNKGDKIIVTGIKTPLGIRVQRVDRAQDM